MASGVYGAALHSFLVTAIADQTEASHLGMAIQSVGIAVSAVPGPVRSISSRKLEVNDPHPLGDTCASYKPLRPPR